MSSSSTNLKGSSFPTKSPCMDNLSTGGSTITKAYEIVHNRGSHFTQSQFSGQQEVSAYNLPDDSIQPPKCVEPSVKLDYPRYINPPQMGVVPCGEYDVSEFGPTNQEKSYDYPLACPACGGQMILQCQLNGSGMITRHRIIHGNLVQRSFEIVHFQPPEDAGRIARDIALEDEIPSILLQEKNMDNASLDGTECDFETQNIIMEEVQKQKPDSALSVLRRDKKAEVSKPNFGDVGFGSDDDDLDIVEVPTVGHNTLEATSLNALSIKKSADFVQLSNGGNCVTTAAVNTSSAEESAKPGIPTSQQEVLMSNQRPVCGNDGQVGNCRSLSPNNSTSSDDRKSDHYVFFEKWRFRKEWKFGLFIDSSVTNGFRKLELLTPQEGRIFINVREELVSQKVINGSDLVAFMPDMAKDKTYIVKPVRYHNSLLTGKTKVRYGREIQTEAIALSARPSESLDSLAQAGSRLKLWSDITGLIDVPAADIRKLMAGSIFQPLHLFRIRVSVPHVHSSTAAYMGIWKLIKMDAPVAGANPVDIPYYFWPTAAERWDDVFVKQEHSKEYILYSRSYPERIIIAPRNHCRIPANQVHMKLTAIVVPLGSQWFAFLAAPIQVTEERLFNFTPKTHDYRPLPLPREIINKVNTAGMELQSRLVSKDDPLSLNEKMDLIIGAGGTSGQLETHRRILHKNQKRDKLVFEAVGRHCI